MRRRAFLGAGAAAMAVPLPFVARHLLGGGGDGRANRAGATATAAESPQRYVLRTPQVAADGPPAHFVISKLQAYQAGAVRVSSDAGVSGSAWVFGRQYPLAPEGKGLAGYVAFGTEDPPGRTVVSMQINDSSGNIQSTAWYLEVLKTQWTVDYITIPPPDPNAPPPPPGLVDEQGRLNQIYAGVTARKWQDRWKAPLPEPLSVSGYFGEQRSFDGGPVQGHHGGTDLAAKAGTPIYATNDGTVVLAERVLTRGNLVVLDHGAGVFSCYGHQQEIKVHAGDTVTQGQTLGLVGTTGLSTGPHLHWELCVSGILVDGLRWLDGTQGF